MTIQSAPATLYSELKSRIDLRQARVAIIGLGYVGLPLALLYTEQKFPVTGFDIDEREDPGNQTVARRDIPKVVGGLDSQASDLAAALYGAIFNRVVRVSSPAAAEMTKLLENIYRCVNIALVNELKLLSLRMGLDIWEVIEAASTKPFGFHPFYPG